jgi:hypothetical protein
MNRYHQIMTKWTCYYVGGNGQCYMEGVFEQISRTPMRLTIRLIEAGDFAQYPEQTVRKIPIGEARRSRFCPAVRLWDDGSITVYHEARGIPFVYELVS